MKSFVISFFILILFCQNAKAHNQSYLCKGYDYSGIKGLKTTELFIELNEEINHSVIKVKGEELNTPFNYKTPNAYFSNLKLKNNLRKNKYCECNINLDLSLKLNKAKLNGELNLIVYKYDIILFNEKEIRDTNYKSCEWANNPYPQTSALFGTLVPWKYDCLSQKILMPKKSINKPSHSLYIKGKDYCDNFCSSKTSIRLTCKTF